MGFSLCVLFCWGGKKIKNLILKITHNEEGIKEGKIKGDLNHKCKYEDMTFNNAQLLIRRTTPPLILLSFNLMLSEATYTTLQSENKKK